MRCVFRLASVVLVLVSALTACSSDPRALSTPTTPATVGPLPLEGVRPLPASAFDVVDQAPLVAAGWNTGVLALDDRGAALLSSQKENRNDPLLLGAVRLSIRAPGSNELTAIPAPRRTEPQQAIGGAMNEHWAVWQEQPGTELGVSAWSMYAFDRSTGRTTQLTRAPMINGDAPLPVPGYTGPTISGDRVFWAQAEAATGGRTVNIYGCEIADCTPERYAAAAAYPVAVGEYLYVISRDPAAKPKDPWERFDITKIDIATKKATVVEAVELEPEQSPGGLAVSERALAWIVQGRPDAITIRDLETGRTTTVVCELEGVEVDLAGGFGYPVATDRFVAWGESMGNSPANVGNYLFLLEEGTLHSLGNASGLYGVDAAGSYISWRDAADRTSPHDITVTIAKLK